MAFGVPCKCGVGNLGIRGKAAYGVVVFITVFIKQLRAVNLFFGFVYQQADLKNILFFVFGGQVDDLIGFSTYFLLTGVQVFVTMFIDGENL